MFTYLRDLILTEFGNRIRQISQICQVSLNLGKTQMQRCDYALLTAEWPKNLQS